MEWFPDKLSVPSNPHGDMDLVVGSGSGVKLYRNDTKNGNHWLGVKVVGTTSNRAGIGAGDGDSGQAEVD